MGVTPIHFEQPVHRDYCGCLHDVSIATMDKYRVVVIDDESCQSLFGAQKIIHGILLMLLNQRSQGSLTNYVWLDSGIFLIHH